jgi:hypothetical protein
MSLNMRTLGLAWNCLGSTIASRLATGSAALDVLAAAMCACDSANSRSGSTAAKSNAPATASHQGPLRGISGWLCVRMS